MNHHTLLQTLVEAIQRTSANEAVITAAWHLAERDDDVTAMAAIAAAQNLPAAVLAAAQARNEIAVAVAYLTRPGVSADERKARLEAEPRAGVLAAVLSSASVNDEDRRVIADKLIAKPTKALSEAVIADKAMPLDAVLVAFGQLAPRNGLLTQALTSAMRSQVDRLSTDAEYAPKLAATVNDVDHAMRLLGHHPDLHEDTARELFARVVEPEFERCVDRITGKPNQGRFVGMLRRIVGDDTSSLTPVALASLRKVVKDDTAVAEIWTSVVGATRASTDTVDQTKHTARVLAAAESTDVAELAELTSDYLNGNNALLQPLLKNPALPFDLVEKLAARLDDMAVSKLVTQRPGDERAVLLAYKRSYQRTVSIDGWKSIKDRREAEREILEYQITRWREESSSWYGHSVNTIISVCDQLQNSELIGLLPWEFVSSFANRYGAEKILAGVGLLQSQHLGTDMKKWETADVLARDFSGSVDELLFAASKL